MSDGASQLRHSQAVLKLEDVRRSFGKLRTRAFLQFHVRGNPFATEPAHNVIEAIGRGVHVRIINLVGVSGEHDLCAIANARDDRFCFQRSKVLCLIDAL